MNFIKSIISDRKDYDAIIDFMIYSLEEFQERVQFYLEHTSQYIFLSSSRVYADSENAFLSEESPRLLDIIDDKTYLSTKEYALEKAREENVLINGILRNFTIIRPYITYYDERL